jgi:threonine/homoserine/homoserine lactone efflux protein
MLLFLSMAGFALASSITPGPVNLVALGSGARHGWRATLGHVMGASLGFTLLLVLIGLGVYELLLRWPVLTTAIRLSGVVYLLFLAWRLAGDDGQLTGDTKVQRPSLLAGAAMQWLNPKAWLASVAGMAAFAADGDPGTVAQFAAIYFVVCYASVAAWAMAGSHLRRHLHRHAAMRRFNRGMALLLGLCAVALLLE